MAQDYNSQMVDLLSATFPRRNEPNVAWGNAISSFLMLPGLRGFWPMSSYDEAGAAYDLSGQGRTLAYNGNPFYSRVGLFPFLYMDGTGDYLSRADEAGLDITGVSGLNQFPGLTMGGWYYFDNVARIDDLMGKWLSGAGNKSYLLYKDVANNLQFYMTTDGTAQKVVTSTIPAIANSWGWIVGRFTPSAELAIWVDGTKTTNVVAIPASIYSGNSALTIGNGSGGTMDGAASLQFLCASALSDTIIKALFQQTRGLFGV